MKKHKLKKQSGMSLIEIIIVIALLGTIMGVVYNAIAKGQVSAMEDIAANKMKGLSTNFIMFKTHTKKRLNPDLGLRALLDDPGLDGWRGPYIESEEAIQDPWGNEFEIFKKSDGKLYLRSAGVDEEFGTADDISETMRF